LGVIGDRSGASTQACLSRARASADHEDGYEIDTDPRAQDFDQAAGAYAVSRRPMYDFIRYHFRPSAVVSRYLDAWGDVLFTLRAELFTILGLSTDLHQAEGRNADDLELVNLCLHTVSYALA
jgi:hypothetical protein